MLIVFLNSFLFQSVSQCLTLAIGMAFMFLRIHYILKAVCGLTILLFYSWAIFDELHYIYENSASMNPGMNPKVAHLLLVVFTVIVFQWIDRQSEYIARVDYK